MLATLAADRARVADLDAEILVQERLDSYQYPVLALPNEIAIEIFLHFLPEFPRCPLISQVCSDWRKVVYGTPRLWAGPICVDLGSRSDGRGQLYADGLEEWLARSAPAPVSVSLKLERLEPNIDARTLELVLCIAPRLYSLHCPSSPFWLIRRLAECRLDSLEELELGWSYSDLDTFETLPLTTAPRLRKASISNAAGELHILVPWAQLTHLTLDFDSSDIILDILSQCATLTSASLITSGWSRHVAAAQSTRPPLTLSHMHTLSLDFGPPELMMQILGVVSAPALEILRLNFWDLRGEMQPVSPLAAFLMLSPNITQLEIVCGAYGPTSHALIIILRHTVRLTHLKLVSPDTDSLDDALIAAMSYEDNVTLLVPHLRDLVLADIDADGIATEALEHMLFSRWRTDAEITSNPAVARWSRLELWGEYNERFVERMEILQRKGLPLKLIS
ncbi:hypothetical protein C8R45DRAFT_1109413 [Mycena sanguinolenta]|nr:hypothetical protein C8R45DRAFT_1109413 [Mycena sanguinolenta]